MLVCRITRKTKLKYRYQNILNVCYGSLFTSFLAHLITKSNDASNNSHNFEVMMTEITTTEEE